MVCTNASPGVEARCRVVCVGGDDEPFDTDSPGTDVSTIMLCYEMLLLLVVYPRLEPAVSVVVLLLLVMLVLHSCCCGCDWCHGSTSCSWYMIIIDQIDSTDGVTEVGSAVIRVKLATATMTARFITENGDARDKFFILKPL